MARRVSRYDLNVLLYRLKKDRAFRERFKHDPERTLAGTDLTDEERDAFVRWNPRRLNELGGSLHLVLSIPDLAAH
jgi:hypothetical protein